MENLHISEIFETSEPDLQIAAHAHFIECTATSLSKKGHSRSTCLCTNCSTTNHEYETMVEFDTGVSSASLLIPRIHLGVAQESKNSNYPSLFTPQDEWTIIMYVMEVVTQFG